MAKTYALIPFFIIAVFLFSAVMVFAQNLTGDNLTDVQNTTSNLTSVITPDTDEPITCETLFSGFDNVVTTVIDDAICWVHPWAKKSVDNITFFTVIFFALLFLVWRLWRYR